MLTSILQPGGIRLAVTAGVALLGLATMGCYCFEYKYASFEGKTEFVVVKRTTRFMGGSTRTFPRVPTEYRVTRAAYELKVSTGGVPYPVLSVQAFDREGNPIEIFAPDMVRTLPALHYGPPVPLVSNGVEEGEWSFDVLRDGETIGRETFHYEIRSRPVACGLDLP